jgi:hypothetical protein
MPFGGGCLEILSKSAGIIRQVYGCTIPDRFSLDVRCQLV